MNSAGWRRIYLGSAVDIELDSSLRIQLPQELRSAAGFDDTHKDALLVGNGHLLELWEAGRHAQAEAKAWQHTTVLLRETVEAVFSAPQGVYVDGTFGRGGHARELLALLAPTARLYAFDKDPQAQAVAQQFGDARLHPIHAGFGQMREELAECGVSQVEGVMLDLGVSSPQIDDPSRGFSFRFDAPLDMRMDTTAEFLERADERLIAQVIRDYGEERFAVQIAKALVARRQGGRPVRSTAELAEIVAGTVKTREPGQNPATRTFQALRIQVNAELAQLEQGLTAALALLKPKGRLAVISFHSLEDRIVKQFIARESRAVVDRRAPFAEPAPSRLHNLARIFPSDAEVAANPRARSAVLRVAERTEVPL
ncbi:hypothetical protein B566_EDAN019373 [Ephemera danica]|nr:hypothetical protein B566_EDAN019373 [Ephemera danica]